jgi:hypothetical protein
VLRGRVFLILEANKDPKVTKAIRVRKERQVSRAIKGNLEQQVRRESKVPKVIRGRGVQLVQKAIPVNPVK